MIYEHRLHEWLINNAATRLRELSDDEIYHILITEDREYDVDYCKKNRPDVYAKFMKLQVMK